MTDDGDLPDKDLPHESNNEGADEHVGERNPGVWSGLHGWTKEHRKHLLALGVGLTAVALGARFRATGITTPDVNAAAVAKAAAKAAEAAAERAAEASARVAREFEALGRDYNMAAMDQTVGQAFRRHQRWDSEELAVLREQGKTALEKALELGRTYNGVKAKAIREGLSSKAP